MKKIRNVMTLLLAALALLFTGSQVFADTTGTITVQNAQPGQSYKLYKLFDATVGDNGAIAYTLPSGKSLDTTGQTYFDVDSAGNVTAKSTTTQSVVGSDEFKAWAKNFAGDPVASKSTTGNSLEFSGLSFGYYFIESPLGATITVDSTTPHAYVVDKNSDGPNSATKDANVESARIGTTVNYTVKYNATNYVMVGSEGKQITDYTIVDTPTNLAINANSVVVKVKSTVTGDEQTITPQSVEVNSTNGKLTVVLPWVNTSTGASLYDTPSEVTITYSATVLPGAAGVTNRTGEATNSAKITYNYDGGSGNTNTETETVKTYGFTINKTNDNQTTTLQGAEFKLYNDPTGGTPVKFVKLSDTMYRIAVSTDAASDCVEVIPAGMTHISGLKDGTRFFLEEIKAPAGYNKLTSRQEVVVHTDQTTANVLNHKGTELPSTGSFGTRMLYVVGAAAILVASVYMVAKRRVKNL